MTSQLIPEPGMEAPVPANWTPQMGVALWIDLVAAEQLLLAGLRREIGPDGDLGAAYRR